MPSNKDIAWFKTEFGARIADLISGTPFSIDMITAIACQETGYIWQVLRKELPTTDEVLALCVGDTLDASAGRRAFPRTRADLLERTNGQKMFGIARQALVDMAKYIDGYKPSAQNPNKFVHGFGIFQYDLQFFLEDPAFFLDKKWTDFDACAAKMMAELRRGLVVVGVQGKSSLTDLEMAYVAIAYNTGHFNRNRGLKQGHESDGKFYGENIYDFIQQSKSVVVPTAGVGAFDAAAAAVADAVAAGAVAQPFAATTAMPMFATAAAPQLSPPQASIVMRALRHGAIGDLVKAWQTFLTGKGFDPGGQDGEFSDKTVAATKAFQQANGLTPDGVAGRQTLVKAMELGFELIEEPASDMTGSNFPPRPNFPPLVDTVARQAVFGRFNYVSQPLPDNPENIKILGSWEDDNIIKVPIPQLRTALGAGAPATMRFHRAAAEQLKGLWAAWEQANLLDRILTYDGAFVPRFIRGSRTVLSNHAFGSAFDINAEWNWLGERPALVGKKGAVRELVPLAHQWGFYWGGHFGSRLDGMHFEIAFIK